MIPLDWAIHLYPGPGTRSCTAAVCDATSRPFHVAIGHQLAPPVAVGMDLRVSGRGTGDAGDHEGGQGPGRMVGAEEPVRLGHVHIDQPVHGRHAPVGPHRCGDQPTAGREWLHLYLARALDSHEYSLPPGRCAQHGRPGRACLGSGGSGDRPAVRAPLGHTRRVSADAGRVVRLHGPAIRFLYHDTSPHSRTRVPFRRSGAERGHPNAPAEFAASRTGANVAGMRPGTGRYQCRL